MAQVAGQADHSVTLVNEARKTAEGTSRRLIIPRTCQQKSSAGWMAGKENNRGRMHSHNIEGSCFVGQGGSCRGQPHEGIERLWRRSGQRAWVRSNSSLIRSSAFAAFSSLASAALMAA